MVEKDLGQRAYECYKRSSQGYVGPAWKDMADEVQAAWRIAAMEVVGYYEQEKRLYFVTSDNHLQDCYRNMGKREAEIKRQLDTALARLAEVDPA